VWAHALDGRLIHRESVSSGGCHASLSSPAWRPRPSAWVASSTALVNNAGAPGPIEVVPVEEWRRQIAVTRALLPAIPDRALDALIRRALS
jgi:NAD(P)-dependent dehydrogenase (short-subunit alcohol dehydrogenase family)